MRTVKGYVRLSTNGFFFSPASTTYDKQKCKIDTTEIDIDQTVNSITMHLEMAILFLPRLSATLITLLLFSPINREWIQKNGAPAEKVKGKYIVY